MIRSLMLCVFSICGAGCSTFSSGIPLEESGKLSEFVGELSSPPPGYEYSYVSAGRNAKLAIVPEGLTAARVKAATDVAVARARASAEIARAYSPYAYRFGGYYSEGRILDCTDPRICPPLSP